MAAAKWIIGLVIIVGAGFWIWHSGWLSRMQPTAPVAQEATTTPQAAQPTNGMSAQNDASDAGIGQDAAAIDAQLKGLSDDSASVTASLNDTPQSVSY